MKKFVCTVCGYVYEGDTPPEFCPQCKVPGDKFKEVVDGGTNFACEHEVGVAKNCEQDVIDGLKANFMGGVHRGRHVSGHGARRRTERVIPRSASTGRRAAYEEAEHAAKFAELLGEVVTPSTKKNLEMRVEAEAGACEGKYMLAKRAKELGYDAIHDTVHEMARDEARHGRGFEGLLKRYF